MTYVLSDIHGNFEKYQLALREIQFSARDTLYVLGDVVDRGKDPMKILLDMMHRFNVIPLAGNHEYMAMSVLPRWAEQQANPTPDFQLTLQEWLLNGGQPTLDQFLTLSPKEQEEVLNYLGEFDVYEELEISGTNYVLAHAGIEHFNEKLPLAEYPPQSFLFCRANYKQTYYPDKFLITGHTPTRNIVPHGDVIYRGQNHIAIDCGCGYTGRLAVLCLETQKEYYI